MSTITVLIADDHPIVLNGVRRILEFEGDIRVVAEALDGREAVRLCREESPDVAIVDFVMPPLDGFDLVQEIIAHAPKTKVIVFTIHDSAEYAIRLLQMGAFGFVTKGEAGDHLAQAVHKVHDGGTYISETVLQKIGEGMRKSAGAAPLHGLSSRELQVLKLIAEGKRTSDIAAELNLSVHTVQTYRRRVLSKLSMDTNAELVRFAMENGLIK